MRKIFFYAQIVSVLLISGCKGSQNEEIRFVGGTSRWIFTNGIVSVIVKPAQGYYEIVRTRDQEKIVSDAYLKIDDDSTTGPGRTFSYSESVFVSEGAEGRYLLVTSSAEGEPGLGLRFGLLPGKDFVVIDAGIMNRTRDTLQVKHMSVLTQGLLYGGKNISEGFRMLDGNAGGEDTRVTRSPDLECYNNFLLTWGRPERREVLVAGGLTYREVEKFVKVEQVEMVEDVEDVEEVENLRGKGYRWESGFGGTWDDIVYDREEVVYEVKGLESGKSYVLAVGWSDDANSRKQSVWCEAGEGFSVCLLPTRQLPSHSAGEHPEIIRFDLPQEATNLGTIQIRIKNEGGINAVVSDLKVTEGKLGKGEHGVAVPVEEESGAIEKLRLTLYARDPVGKRIDPGASWFPEDAFFVSVGHSNPFEALESYGRELKAFQKIDLEYYTFPTVCLWYAQHYLYGDGPSVNDAPGAVAEMDRAVSSGFLRYSPVAIRLVPDAYESNNEQGWWDEKHWQMYGTGKYANPPDRNVDVAPGHYKKPYETTAKWAGAILERGGIPLTYFQTARRSDDYAEAFPGHMLFNRSDARVPDDDWMINGKGTYDFTDPDFQQHMRDVYRNLADGGVKGLMYDYPYTARARFGGMEDGYSTMASAYRTVYQLAREGLGPEAWLDERNLDYGSDITLGIVSSQRIWGDTDRMSPLMISRGALRWYKNRQVISYDMDAKNLLKMQPQGPDGVRKLLTLMYTTCGRFLMANSFARLTPDQVRDMSRIFPYPSDWTSARPADAFTSRYPGIFVFQPEEGWMQLVVYNPDDEKPVNKEIAFNSPEFFGAFRINEAREYHAYEFWDDRYLGLIPGGATLSISLRPGEAKMISLREKREHPQLVSSDRHIMQGWIETRNLAWNPENRSLTGAVQTIEGEPLILTLADNGFLLESCRVEGGSMDVISRSDGIVRLRVEAGLPGWHDFTVQFASK